ncbi:gas vesicle protein GvpN [Haloferax mediterranei ATCC 33500]|uniref:Gas vesicle ATPase GvpN n=2 Tax=Haloferax mediterranei (strain ATCC 33500 / DSM 1411 / JCM 8866 / NBRC 14739 / NCIMB 2177 / R-4) TaxID=523841 RepID=GVPN_HALMT|nr:gas vesicle protein GvpN [Haloferax mediterranei]Q02239.1 RecName: Full=Gas vesicle ATPase GvpN; AltName: Full=Gas vesicle protein N; Short=GvpN [Haloferax mediterranei ATCC 33500]AFK19400.1 gas-vesicle operon protein gvpN [Haloferax mediterranei ATCC 33500]AHZ21250.1 ATPase AAA [Haloferax mediterranei ATCC 33500]EMA04411.1 gas-vesicle operon protein gvpN [Haloferax mediterranei ATCC 33500]MDX5989503.1 gas vesicle protein GvpN [Haloferax mediterranei ATCC 33500]QCQ75862.1 gas vesicle prote
MTNSSRERKVRGSQIRTSRREKQDKNARNRTEKELTRLENHQTHRTKNGTSKLDERFIPEEQPFIETEAVTQVETRMRRWLDVGRPVHLIGPTGCGKTALAMHVARERDRPVVWINGDADLTTSDLVGEYAEKERISERDKYVHNVVKSKDIVRDRWVDNPLTLAVREGATLVYNEFSRTKPVANNVLLSVFEEGVLELPGQRGKSRYVDVHPDFRAILTSNSVEYAGVHEPQDALLDRLVGLYLDFYDRETEVEIVRAHVDDFDTEDTEQIVRLMRELRERLDVNVGTRAAIMAAEGLTTVDDLDRSILTDICVDVLASKVAQHSDVHELRDEVEATIKGMEGTLS